MIYDDAEAWSQADPEDLWVYDKLLLSKKLGYTCGPAGVDVPKPGNYIVRPITNMLGMGINAEIKYLNKDTDYLSPGTFWCEIFKGRHFTVDYIHGGQSKCYEGFKQGEQSPLYQWNRWEREKYHTLFPYPSILPKFKYLNCEYIGDKLIEVHLRLNPDARYNSDLLIPVWEGDVIDPPKGMKFVEDRDYKRIGFYINE